MPIRVEHGRPETLIAAAQRAGEAQAALRAQEQAERLQTQQMEFDYRTALRQQDIVIDLQMQERSKMWEIEKMEISSRTDFAREEQKRQRVLDELDAATKYINDSDLFDEGQKERLLFTAKLKASKADIPGLSKILFPTEPTQRQVSPTQKISAMKRLREEEYQEPTPWEKIVPQFLGGRPSELSPEIQAEKQILQSIISGQYAAPTGTITTGIPLAENIPSTAAEFESIVAQLKRTDMNAAKEYYNKWAGQF